MRGTQLLLPVWRCCRRNMMQCSTRACLTRDASQTFVYESRRACSRKVIYETKFADNVHLTEHLMQNIVYESDTIVAFNKPVGIPMMESSDKKTTVTNSANVVNCLESLKEELDCGELHIVQGPIKHMAGIILMAKSEKARQRLAKSLRNFKQNHVCYQHYLVTELWPLVCPTFDSCQYSTSFLPQAVCKGVPVIPDQQTETLFVSERKIGTRWESILVERPKQQKNILRKEGLKVTRFVVGMEILKTANLTEFESYSLVRLKASTFKFDSLQLYMTTKFSPILGDHVYSHRISTLLGKNVLTVPEDTITEPQKLSDTLCKRLGLTLKDCGVLPLHLHRNAVEIKFYPYKTSKGFVITAPLPEYFNHTLQSLDLMVDSGRMLNAEISV